MRQTSLRAWKVEARGMVRIVYAREHEPTIAQWAFKWREQSDKVVGGRCATRKYWTTSEAAP